MSDLPALPALPATVLAGMLMIPARRLQQLARDGVIPSAIQGRYDLAATVQGYVAHLMSQSERLAADRSDVMQARARLLEARARAAEANELGSGTAPRTT